MIEIQIHPSDIRRRVRYFFLDRRRVVTGIVVLSIVLAGLIGSMAAAPTVIRRVYKVNFHKGLDLSAPTGTSIYATADGVVTFAGRVPLGTSVNWWRFGNVVTIKHSDRFITIYGHCDTVKVRTGQEVRQGDTIATVGSTGWSTNSHLHYEVRTDLELADRFDPIDPRIYILNYQWSNEALLLMRARAIKEYRNFDPLPTAFTGSGKRRS